MQSATPFHTLHGIQETAESRKDVAIDGAQAISVPAPTFFGGGVLLEGERRVANMMRVPSKNPLLPHRVTCSKSLGLKF